jgi:hypothetical protein
MDRSAQQPFLQLDNILMVGIFRHITWVNDQGAMEPQRVPFGAPKPKNALAS